MKVRRIMGGAVCLAGASLLAYAAWTGVGGAWSERRDRTAFLDSIASQSSTSPSAPDALGILRVDRLGWSVIVRRTATAADLARGAGWIAGTAEPGQTGNLGIAGHRDTFFRPLAQIRLDDELSLVSPNTDMKYRVTEILIVEPRESDVLAATVEPTLTLVTCYPFHFTGPAPKRFIVRARAAGR
jgi:sortase A